MSAVEEVWHGDGAASAMARLALRPLAAAFGGIVRARSALYDAGVFHSEPAAIPSIGVGNLTVGGTGKTPVSAWFASRLATRARTAIVLRGYGADELEVHARLNPAVPVVANANRVEAVQEARARGAEVAVLDDAFQHRRLVPTVQVVLIAVEQLAHPVRLLPAGPWREPLSAARRSDLVILTRKAANAAASADAGEVLARLGRPLAHVLLAPAELRVLDGAARAPLARLRETPVLAIAAIGEPDSFRRQLADLGARVTIVAFRDHHDFTAADAARLAERVPDGGFAVCTLKDAVKLAPVWAGRSPLWYLSQQLVVERGEDEIDRLLERVLAARSPAATFAG
jgi:tetraacyldisaccharide 4'-kinase